MKNTPGPWRLVLRKDNERCFDVVAQSTISLTPHDFYVCHLFVHTDREDESEANARLIAAAPDMLEALEFILAQWPENTDLLKRAVVEQAIAKAIEGAE